MGPWTGPHSCSSNSLILPHYFKKSTAGFISLQFVQSCELTFPPPASASFAFFERKPNVKSWSPFRFLLVAFVLVVCSIGGARAQYFFVASYTSNTIVQFDASGNSTILSSAALNEPSGLALDNAGNLYVANYNGNTIIKFDTNGNETGFAASGLVRPYALAFDAAGNLYAANYLGNSIEKFNSSRNGSMFTASGIKSPVGLAFDGASNLYVANFGNNTIEKINPSGQGALFATNVSGSLNGPFGLAFDRHTNLYVANYIGGTIEKFDTNGNGTVFASSLTGPAGLFIDSGTNLYVTSFSGDSITELNSAGNPSAFANIASGLYGPLFMAAQPGFVSPPGLLYIHQSGPNVVLNWGTPLSFALQVSPSVNGIYSNVPGASSPYTNAISGTNLFFRTVPAS
jgi:hypothetical protein